MTDRTDRTDRTRSSDVTWHDGQISRADRERLLGQHGAVVWFTGLSGSGKSTVAVAVETRLLGAGRLCYRVDGDNLRHGLNKNLGFSPDDRAENVRRTGEVCRILADTGVIVLASLVSPFRAERERVRAMHAEAKVPFMEVFVDVPLEVAESRDPKGLYRKARAGEIKDFTGVHQPYEAPTACELTLPASTQSVDACALQVVQMLRDRHIV
ncbi:MAG: adenylyl-sulfate kinase [Planctomycetota bacterium]|nr:adenylyl-sulfate kinase [Planctomycetota bacterium]